MAATTFERDFPDKTVAPTRSSGFERDFPDKPQPGLLRRAYRGLTDVASKPFEWAGKLDVASGIKTKEEAERRAKEYGKLSTDFALTAPLTLGGGAVGSAAARGAGVLPKVLPAAGRIAGSTAGGALTGAGQGKSPANEGLVSGLANLGAELLPPAVRNAPKLVKIDPTLRLLRSAADKVAEAPNLAGPVVRDAIAATKRELGTMMPNVGRVIPKIQVPGIGPLSIDDIPDVLRRIEERAGPQAVAKARDAVVGAVARLNPSAALSLEKGLGGNTVQRMWRAAMAQVDAMGQAAERGLASASQRINPKTLAVASQAPGVRVPAAAGTASAPGLAANAVAHEPLLEALKFLVP